MAIYYVDSTAGGTNTGGSWANAFLTFAQAVTAATLDGDLIYVSHAHSESVAADTTYTFAANVRVLCVNSGTGALATTAVIGAQAGNFSINFFGAKIVYVYGMELKTGTAGSTVKPIGINGTDGGHFELESCKLTHVSTGACTVQLSSNASGAGSNYTKLRNCTFKFGSVNQTIQAYGGGPVEMVGCSVDATGSAPTTLFSNSGNQQGANITLEGCDLSLITGTLIADRGNSGHTRAYLINCKLGVGVTIAAAAATILHKGNTSVWVYNCASDDTHYVFGHYDAFGKTETSAAIYANDGATVNGTNVSHVITTTANCSYYTPYVSPWFYKRHTGTTAITPYVEILRDGSATAYNDNEVWGEFSYQGTTGFPQSVIVSDRMTPLGTPAAQATGTLSASGWTGENATAWFGKLAPASAITPAEVGTLAARVVVGVASSTVYVDPQIRGAA